MPPNLPKQQVEFMEKVVSIFEEKGFADMDDGERWALMDFLKTKLS